ncbi:chemotaxis protein [Litorilituus lipolyticus]|uniref:Chemotaxis protein n=1 Tax=Litorilituus lipolyticus TaxID=2491017 RepID=A0A502L5Z8_9GAMM|nr:chemotaxis protein [Litorilituus lipolyticus]TPH15757.1 chemotaxis protein [Litorilituus lipolyticus]
MTDLSQNYFVSVAEIAAKLDQATTIAQKLSLTASNARAVALRAGERAAGFRPLTDFIDRLAEITIGSSKKINQMAAVLSQTSAEKVRADGAILHFNSVYKIAHESPYIHSLDEVYERCKSEQDRLEKTYRRQIEQLSEELATLSSELRNAVILATLSRVEASQAGAQYQDALINVADNVEGAAGKIKNHIKYSQQMVSTLEEY